MNAQELGQKCLEQGKADLKVMLKNQIEILFAEGMELGLDELKKLIPGAIDDAIIEALEPQLKEVAKAYALALISKI